MGVGIADFDVRSGSALSIPTGDVVLGEQAGDDGGMTIHGVGSSVTMDSGEVLIAGQSGVGQAQFQAGAGATLGGLRIGLNVGSSGAAIFDGLGTVATTNTISVGGDQASIGGIGVLTVSGGADVTVSSTAVTDAIRVWPAGDLSVLGPSILEANKPVRVSGGEVFMDQGATILASQFVLETGSDLLVNATGTGGPAVIEALASLTGSATIQMGGDLTIGSGFNPSGFSAAANSTVNLDGNTLTILDSNTAFIGIINLSTPSGGQNGVLIAPKGVSLPSAGCKLFGSGTVKGDVHVVGSGVVINPAGGGMSMEGTLFNNPPATISGSTLRFVNGGGFNGGGTIACPVFADGLSKVHAIGTLTLGNAGLTNGTQIGGTLRLDNSVTATLLDSDGVTLGTLTELATSPIIGSDAVLIQSVGLNVPVGSTLQGAGLIDCPSIGLGGVIKPGDLDGVGAGVNPVPLKFDGAVTIGHDAAYHCDLSMFLGLPVSDRIEVVSPDKLNIDGGTLEVQALPAYTPAAGDSFDVVIAPGGISGEYAKHILPFGASVHYLSDRVRVTFDGLCYPDCDASSALGIDDFICFQTFFALGDPYADCDASGTLGIDDFICFQTFFAIGC